MNFYETNPFQALYVTDDPDPRVYVELFSDIPVVHSSALFQAGNVVLKGTQGSGKSMLLNLLKPEIRLQYSRSKLSFPVPEDMRKFVGAGINLSLSGILNVGQRPIVSSEQQESQIFPLFFADFLNYFVVRDLLYSVELIEHEAEAFENLVDGRALAEFARLLASQDCWFGYLNDCAGFEAVCRRIDDRLASYRAFHQYNADLPQEIQRTKTAIGEPIAIAAECLKNAAVIDRDTPVFVRVDQIERLYRSDVLRSDLGRQYRRMINKAIGSRDTRISYRIGTRPYAWDDDLTIYGSEDKLEDLRDFRRVDLDEMLRRREDAATWIFPEFAGDAFGRRLRHARYMAESLPGGEPEQSGSGSADVIELVFRSTPNPRESAREYAGTASATRALGLDENWPEPWVSFLSKLFSDDPFEATLAAAWARQRGRSGKRGKRLEEPPPTGAAPWGNAVWRADRMRQCVTQIAARCAQRLKWSGKEDILALSSGNISIFLSICHEVWDAFLRAERKKARSNRLHPLRDGIPRSVQAVGIQTASRHWYEKISERPKGHDRQRFVDVLGRIFRGWLLDDEPMSYPGHTGFSLLKDELDSEPLIRGFLNEAVDYGDLFDAPHTTKESNRKPRRKWYLAPILSVMYQIPEAHKKEPHYASISKVKQWLHKAGVVIPGLDLDVGSEPPAGEESGDNGPETYDPQRHLPFDEYTDKE